MTSLPHVQDWYALTRIRECSLIDDDAVLLPGFAAVLRPGYALPSRFGGARNLLTSAPTRSEVLTAIARNHTAVQGSYTAWQHLPLLREEILRCEKETPLTGERGVQGLMSWFNVRERQAKYINNSTKSYEFFGYDWALPMLDSEVWDCWLRGSEELTATRDWYARYIAQHYATMTGQDQELYLAASISMPATPKRVLQVAMRATGGDRLLSRSRSMRTMLDHPMAFEAFSASIPRIEQARRFAAGNTTLGLWTRLTTSGAPSWCHRSNRAPDRWLTRRQMSEALLQTLHSSSGRMIGRHPSAAVAHPCAVERLTHAHHGSLEQMLIIGQPAQHGHIAGSRMRAVIPARVQRHDRGSARGNCFKLGDAHVAGHLAHC
ncbi:hypothetical protein [Actinomyces ruminis]|uniref:hypothetical protein n=1 Tax=Actinomyces ruminis TaxID=1937003 RepID=UPI000B67DF31|nr:hypothetical protein [Actinomyces ruminis]